MAPLDIKGSYTPWTREEQLVLPLNLLPGFHEHPTRGRNQVCTRKLSRWRTMSYNVGGLSSSKLAEIEHWLYDV